MEKLHRNKVTGFANDLQAKGVSAAALVAAGANGGCGLVHLDLPPPATARECSRLRPAHSAQCAKRPYRALPHILPKPDVRVCCSEVEQAWSALQEKAAFNLVSRQAPALLQSPT
jgi:hypothetical protein